MPSFELLNCLTPILFQLLIVQAFFYEKCIPYDDRSVIKATLDHFNL